MPIEYENTVLIGHFPRKEQTMAISVPVPKDLSGIKTKVALNLTKRQIICFSGAALVGVPLYFLTKGVLGTQGAALIMVGAMLPFFFLAMYEKDGLRAAAVLPISREMPMPGRMGRAWTGKSIQKREYGRIRKLLDKKSRSPKRASRGKTALLQRIKAWISKRKIPGSINQTMFQRLVRKSRCTSPFLDKKSKSPM